jgi:hypothetical protein
VTASIVAPLDHGAAHRLDSRIRLLAVNIADNLTKLTNLVAEAEAGQIHLTLGFKSWTAYLASALAKLDTWTTTDSRRELVDMLAHAGMSQRAIAQAVGVNQATVSRDQQVMHDASPAPVSAYFTDAAEEADIMAMADVTDAEFQQVLAEARAEGDLSRQNVANKCAPAKPVTGLDGKTYTKPKPKAETAKRAATFTQLMKRLTELNRVASECLDIAEELSFDTEAKWNGLTYDSQQQFDSAKALADGLWGVVGDLLDAVENKADE